MIWWGSIFFSRAEYCLCLSAMHETSMTAWNQSISPPPPPGGGGLKGILFAVSLWQDRKVVIYWSVGVYCGVYGSTWLSTATNQSSSTLGHQDITTFISFCLSSHQYHYNLYFIGHCLEIGCPCHKPLRWEVLFVLDAYENAVIQVFIAHLLVTGRKFEILRGHLFTKRKVSRDSFVWNNTCHFYWSLPEKGLSDVQIGLSTIWAPKLGKSCRLCKKFIYCVKDSSTTGRSWTQTRHCQI